MSDPTRHFSSVVVNPDDVVTVGPIEHSSSAFSVDLETLRRQLTDYNAARIKQTNLDELVAALGVCAKHGLDLLNDEHVAMPVALPEERAIHIIAYAADITPAQLIRAWDAIHAHIKNGGAS